MQYLDLDDYLYIASVVHGVEPQVLAKASRIGLADSALHAPSAGSGDIDLYLGLATKAAILGSRLNRNHPLPDGNKRAAFLAMVEFVERNGRTWLPVDETDAFDTLLGLAAGTVTEDDFIAWVSRHVG